MTSTAVRVGLRIRPLTEKEGQNNCIECISCIPDTPQISIGDKSFTYDYVFHNKTAQLNVYQQAASPLLHTFVDGFNATILAYGQTGSGKTYSMGTTLTDNSENKGNTNCISGNPNPLWLGIVPRCILEMFELLESNQANDADFKYQVKVSFLELYNEEIIDLLNNIPRQRKSVQEVSIREDSTGQIYWSGVKEEDCQGPEDVLNFLAQGSLQRTTGSTEMNSVSSRSHAIFSVVLKQTKTQQGKQKNLTSKFHFVDLAGSERLKKTHAQGDRAREGIAINSGLLALGNVISALGDEGRKTTHVPYRDSKLTRLLQDSLGGNSQTLMLACVSPADANFQETLSTLKYANRARNIKNKVSLNQEFAGSTAEVNQLRALVAKLRLEIAAHEKGAPDSQLKEQVKTMATQISLLTRERDTLMAECQLVGANPQLVLSESKRDRKLRRVRRPTKSTSGSLKKKYARKIKFEEDEDEGFVNDFQEHDGVRHEEIKESITKVRADIRKSMEVLDLVKPLEDLPRDVLVDSPTELKEPPKLTTSRMLQQIQADIQTKQELVTHLEKSEGEYTFMRKKFDEKISQLELQISEIQSSGQQKTSDNQKIKQMTAKIQDLQRKCSAATNNVNSARSQNESALNTLKKSLAKLEAEKKRLIQKMRLESERVREKMTKQEQKIQHLLRQQALYNQAKVKLQREHKEQRIALEKSSEACVASTTHLKQIIQVLKRAVREGGILDDKMLAGLSPIIGGNFAVIVRGGGHGFPIKKKKNSVPLKLRVARKKQQLDKALELYVQGKQTLGEMEKLLDKTESLERELEVLKDERDQLYDEKEHDQMENMAVVLLDERISLVSSEIDYLNSRISTIQKEACGDPLETECLPKQAKHVMFVDEILAEEEEWMDVDILDDQFNVPVNATPEIAYATACKLIQSLELDECQKIVENLMTDKIQLTVAEHEKQTTMNDMEQMIIELNCTLGQVQQNNEQSMLELITPKSVVSENPLISLPDSPVASPYNNIIQPLKSPRESATPSPDRFFNIFQKRWQPQDIETYLSDHESSTSSILSSHIRRLSIQSNISQSNPQLLQQPQQQHYQRPSPIQKLIKKSEKSSVFDRLAQTPTSSSKAKISFRHSSGSVDELLQNRWEAIELENRPSSASSRYA